jgi:hypothetical protein
VKCFENNIIQIDDLSSASVYIEINTNNLNLDSLKKYKEHLLRFAKLLDKTKTQKILNNIDERIEFLNFQLVSGRNKEISVNNTNETVQNGNLDLIRSYMTSHKSNKNAMGGTRKSNKQMKNKRHKKSYKRTQNKRNKRSQNKRK